MEIDDEKKLEKWEDYLLNNYLDENSKNAEEKWDYQEDYIDYTEV